MKTKKTEQARVGVRTDRRALLQKSAALGAGLVIGAGMLASREATAAALPPLAEDNPQARALGYRHNAADVDSTKYKTADAAANNCANCQLFQPADDSAWGGCPLFAGKGVNAQGWCTAWVKRAG